MIHDYMGYYVMAPATFWAFLSIGCGVSLGTGLVVGWLTGRVR